MKENTMLKLIQSTRDYLNYVEEHYHNVQKAWDKIKECCHDMKFIYDDYEFALLEEMVWNHDVSKMSLEEFVPYRDKFFPSSGFEKELIEARFDIAWENHKEMNDHHWQTWTTRNYHYPNMQSLCCVHMICDWMAMSYKFGGTAKQYYEDNKHKIELPDWAIDFMYDIFNRVYK